MSTDIDVKEVCRLQCRLPYCGSEWLKIAS